MMPVRMTVVAIVTAFVGGDAWSQVAPTPSTEAALSPYFSVGSVASDRMLSLPSEVDDWYKDAVVYHLWVAAFRDSDGDAIGDLPGIIEGLDTLRELGVNTIWLSPFFASASSKRNLHGYDVIDHYQVDPRLGTNEDAFTLIRAAHARGMRLIFDLVPNHLSSRHPWFLESRDPQSPKRNWFLWRDDRPADGWTGFDRRSDWHALGDDYYYGIFWAGMPDLNHRNPEARRALAEAARFWLDRGFDGIRMDAVKYLFENLDGTGVRADQEDQPETIEWFKAWRREVMDPYTSEGYPKFMVAENWTQDRDNLLIYLTHQGQPVFHMTLNFPMLSAFTQLDPAAAREVWEWDANLPADAWLGTFTSNHDMAADRPGTLFAGAPRKLRAQAAWLLLGPGTPFIYYGNEIAQAQGPERGDVRHRKPLDWDEVARQRQDADSPWRWTQKLIKLRLAHISLRRGKATFLTTNANSHALALWRESGEDVTLTLFNGSGENLDSLVVNLPENSPVQSRAWVLGEGTLPTAEGVALHLGPLAAYGVKVLYLEK